MNTTSRLAQGLDELGIDASGRVHDTLAEFASLLLKWNNAYNLTAITDREDVEVKHLLDSLAISALLRGKNIIDVGSGGGLPGIPLAIVHPDKNFTLVDASAKKTRFLKQAVYELGLKNVNVEHGRIENLQGLKFDTVTCRAFASIEKILTLCSHLLDEGGYIQALKAVDPSTELEALNVAFRVLSVDSLSVPFLDAERHLVTLQKIALA